MRLKFIDFLFRALNVIEVPSTEITVIIYRNAIPGNFRFVNLEILNYGGVGQSLANNDALKVHHYLTPCGISNIRLRQLYITPGVFQYFSLFSGVDILIVILEAADLTPHISAVAFVKIKQYIDIAVEGIANIFFD